MANFESIYKGKAEDKVGFKERVLMKRWRYQRLELKQAEIRKQRIELGLPVKKS